jgi:hypothetical protein
MMKFLKTLLVLAMLTALLGPTVSAQEVTSEPSRFVVDYWGALDFEDYIAGCSAFLEDLWEELAHG